MNSGSNKSRHPTRRESCVLSEADILSASGVDAFIVKPLDYDMPDDIPDYLRSTTRMMKSAFPDGLPAEDYFPLLCLFRQEGWSFRNIATAMQACFGVEYPRALNDSYRTEGPTIPVDAVESLRQRLVPHGFELWQKEQQHQ